VAAFDTDTGHPDTTDSTSAASSSAPETASSQTPTDTQPSSGTQTDQTASPSDATPLSEREGLLAAVRAVVNTQETPASDTEDAATQTGQDRDANPDTAGTTGADPGTQTPDIQATPAPDPTEAELRKLRPETRRRFEQLLAQRDEARTSLTALTPEIEQHRQLQGYLRENQLAPEDVNVLLGVGAALRRGDYQGFLNGVMPYVMAAEEAVGRRFAPDLQQQVNDGLITEDTAREVTQARFRANQAEGRLHEATTTRAQEDQGRALAEVRTAVETWEANVRARDPDYALKAAAVRRFAQGLMQERGAPRDPSEAVKLVSDAYREATETFVRARPPPRPTRTAPSGINGASHAAVPEPVSMKEAAIMALRNMRRAS
jgi:hypothetical protein